MKSFCFTVDDNIRFFKELMESGCKSLFDHPYLAMYRRLHQRFDLKVQLNLFYRWEDFDLTAMTDAYQPDFEEKLAAVFSYLTQRGYESAFFQELL